MKNIIRLITCSVLMLLVAACSTDGTKDVFDPNTDVIGSGSSSADGSGAFFKQQSISREFPMESADQLVDITVTRQSAKGEETVGLYYTVDKDALEFIEIPNSVTFADGEYETNAKVLVKNISSFTKGVTYTAVISLGDNQGFEEVTFTEEKAKLPRHPKTRAAATGYTTVTLSFAMELIWQPMYILKDPSNLPASKYFSLTEDDFKHNDANGSAPSKDNRMVMTAEYYSDGFEWLCPAAKVERADGTNVFRLVDFRLDEDGDYVNIIWTLDEDEKNKVEGAYLHAEIGMQPFLSEGGTLAYYVSDASALGYSTVTDKPCIWDGQNTFYFTTVLITPSGSAYGFFNDMLTLATGEPAPEVEIEYNGITKNETGFASGSVTFTPNNDVDVYYATVIDVNIDNLEDGDEIVESFIAAAKAGKKSFERSVYGGYMTMTYPILTLTEADTREWKFASSYYTAMAYSVYEDETNPYENFDYEVFYADTDFDSQWAETAYLMVGNFLFEYFGGAEYGYLPCNSICFYVEPFDEDGYDPVTGVTFAAVPASEYNSASYMGNEAYLSANGTSWGSTDIAYVNDGRNYDWIGGLKPDTKYVVLIEASTKNGSRIYEEEAETDPVPAYSPLQLATDFDNDMSGRDSYFTHTNILATFSVESDSDFGVVSDGAYASIPADTVNNAKLEANKVWSELFEVKDGKATLKSGKTDKDVVEALAANGTHFTKSGSAPDFDGLNYDGNVTKVMSAVAPNTEVLVLGYVEYPDGKTSWAAAVNTTKEAPVASFEQTATMANGKVQFNWSADADFAKQEVRAVNYTLATAAELAAAGVDTSKLADSNLNGKDADADNVKALKALLSAQGKVFTGDQAYWKINSAAGYTGQFNAPASGACYLVAYATTSDKYVTKLTVTALQ